LSDAASAVGAFSRYLRPGGILAVEDIDFSGLQVLFLMHEAFDLPED
jgi:hypothetical protein